MPYPDDYTLSDRMREDAQDQAYERAAHLAYLTAQHFLKAPELNVILDHLDLGDGPSTDTLAQFMLDEYRAGNPRAYEIMHAIAAKIEEYAIGDNLDD